MATVLCARDLAMGRTRHPGAVMDQLSDGDRVFVLPDAGVYLFEGRENGGFWLRPIQTSSTRRATRLWAPDREAWRLQPTFRLRPMGSPGKENWKPASANAWDAFSGSTSNGNPALGSLAIVLVGERASFEVELEAAGYAVRDADPACRVADGLARGLVDDEGDVRITVPSGAAGEPLIAIARNHQAAARLSARNPDRTLIFLSTRVGDALADRSVVGMIAARHRFLLIASPRHREELASAAQADWLVVEPRGLDAKATGLQALDRTAEASRWETRSPGVLDQKSPELHEAFVALDLLGKTTAEHAFEDEDVSTCVQALRGAFFDASDWLAAPGESEISALEVAFGELHERLGRLRSIAGPAAVEAASSCRSALDRFALVTTRLSVTPKGECVMQLADAASRAPQFRQAIVAGHGRAATRTAGFLEDLGLSMPCLTPTALAGHEPFSRINILSMMGREAFTRLIDPWPAPDLMFLGYQHEVEIYRNRLAARDRMRRRFAPDDAICALFPFLLPHRAPPAPVEAPASPPIVDPASIFSRPLRSPPTTSGEQLKDARVCRFAGQSWMAVAPEKTMTRVRPSRDGLQLTSCSGGDLETGDLVLVREGADRDIVRDMAATLVGEKTYADLRSQAAVWRNSLIATGLSAENLRRHLAKNGVERGIAALRYWLAEEGPIGPSEEEITVPAIAAALGENHDAARWSRCVNAIQALRALHTRAGFSLTDALTGACGGSLVEHSDHETPITLPWGVVWLLEVEAIGQPEAWPYTMINRLRWESDSWRRRLLSQQLLARITGDAA